MRCYFRVGWRYRLGTTMLFLGVVGFSLLATATRARADIHDSLVVHLRFDGDVQDYSGRGNHGTIVRPGAASPYVPGIIGQAFQTTGSSKVPDQPTGTYITLGNPDDLNFDGSSDISFSWWGLYNATDQHDDIPWLSNKDWWSGGNRGWVLAAEDGRRGLRWNFRARGEDRKDISGPYAGGIQSGPNGDDGIPWDDGKWHHYVVTFTRGDDGVATVYQDGVLAVTRDDTQNPKPLGSALYLGYSVLPTNILQDGTGLYTDENGGAGFDLALIDDLGIWRRALSDAEVSSIYNLGLQGKSALD